MPVGGVRIEDDILITSKGYENLTTAPKGNAMFDIIRGNKSTVKNPKRSTASSSPATEPQLFRAPGCPLQTPPPAMQSIKRAATMPNESTQEQIGGFKRLDHSLGFRRSMMPASTGETPKAKEVETLEIETLPHLVAEVAGRQIEVEA